MSEGIAAARGTRRVAERRDYLTEVQGLRTLAALLVATYHVWLHRVSGGVDVFFVVAAYFMVAGFLRREPVRAHDVPQYYGTTARRVVPGAALVILATIAAGLLLTPDALWRPHLTHALASILFVENWWLARLATDYVQQGFDTSPFQQMWALSLQMQVYLAFPLVYLVASRAAGLFRAGPIVTLTIGFGAIFVASLAWSIHLTARDQPAAYFISVTRLWEFAAGALLALWIGRIRLLPLLAKLLGWAGLLVLVTLGLGVDVSRQFPGYLAGLPVLAALAIIVSAANGGDIRLLNNRVMTAAADMSFAFYLWHWPLLIFMRYRLGDTDVGLVGGVLVLVGAGFLAFLSTRLVETPLRRWSWLAPRPVLSIVASLALLLMPAGALYGWSQLLEARISAAIDVRDRVLADPSRTVPPGQTVPAPVMVHDDRPGERMNLCDQSFEGTAVITCVRGDREGAVTIAAVGGSHVSQWMRTLNAIGKREGYRIVSIIKDGCTFTTDDVQHRSCPVWNKAAMRTVLELKPDLVFAIATRASWRDDAFLGESVPRGYRRAFARLAEHGIPVLGLRDNPRFAFDVAQCVSAFAPDWATCGRALEEVIAATSPTGRVTAPDVHFADFTDIYCSDGFCPAVKNGILIYRDRDHLTGTFAYLQQEAMAAAIAAALAKAGASEATP
jgi:peptidoglycan/LPS O-acetylase OafA/YrhL